MPKFKVTSEHELQAEPGTEIEALSPLHAMVFVLTGLAQDDELVPAGIEPGETTVEDWIITAPDGRHHRFRLIFDGPSSFSVDELQACRACGCTNDRACNPPCAWAEPDLCTACVPATPKMETANG